MQKNIISRTFSRFFSLISPRKRHQRQIHAIIQEYQSEHNAHDISYLLSTVFYYSNRLEEVLDDYYRDFQELVSRRTTAADLSALVRDYELKMAALKVHPTR